MVYSARFWTRGVAAKHAALSRPRSRVRISSGPPSALGTIPSESSAELLLSGRWYSLTAVIRVETGDLAVLNVGDEQAAPAAVVGRAADADFIDGGRWTVDGRIGLRSMVYGLFLAHG